MILLKFNLTVDEMIIAMKIGINDERAQKESLSVTELLIRIPGLGFSVSAGLSSHRMNTAPLAATKVFLSLSLSARFSSRAGC